MRIKQGRFGSNDFRRDKFVARIVSDGISRDIPSLTIRVTNKVITANYSYTGCIKKNATQTKNFHLGEIDMSLSCSLWFTEFTN